MGNYLAEERYRVWNTDAYTELVNYQKIKKIKKYINKIKNYFSLVR